MKKKQQIGFTLLIAICYLLFANCASKPAVNPDEVSLNTAIRQAAERMESRLDRGTRIALINFTSPSQAFSEYVLDELSSILVNNGHLVVVDRANLDRIRQELGFNASGEVSDASAQEIGQMLGAQAVVTGSLTSIGDLRHGVLHRVMFKTIITETAAVVVQHNADIANDRRVQALLAQGGGSQGVNYGSGYANTSGNGNTSSQSNTASGRTTTTPSQTANIQNGTYTFFPRPRLMKEGRDVDSYLDKIVVRGGFFTMYFVATPRGQSSAHPDLGPWHYLSYNATLDDLDRPTRSANSHRYERENEGNNVAFIWIFENHNISHFSFKTFPRDHPNETNRVYTIEEVRMEDAEYTP